MSAPLSTNQANLSAPLSSERAPFCQPGKLERAPFKRGALFPILKTESQELRMDGGMAKADPTCSQQRLSLACLARGPDAEEGV